MSTLIDRYRHLPALGGRALLPVSFLARLPVSMTQLGTVLLVTTATGSLGYAGATAGVLALGMALASPVLGHVADTRGQRPVMIGTSLANAVLLVGLVLAVLDGAPVPVTLALAFVVGATTPQIGPLLRSRWVRLTGGDSRLPAAMAYEGAADEVSYVLGPAVVSLLALISPATAVLVAAVLVGVFGTWSGVHRTARATSSVGITAHRSASVRRNVPVLLLIAVAALIGTFFGGMQTGVTATATAAGSAASAGLAYSVMAIGSALTGLAVAALPERFRLSDRLVLAGAWTAVLLVPLLMVGTLPAVVGLLALLGTGIGPMLVTVYALAERQIRADRSGVVMTLLASGTIVGYAVGASVGGAGAQASGPAAAFLVSLTAMVVGTAVALVLRARLTTVPAATASPGTA